jgi:hypothetical protein
MSDTGHTTSGDRSGLQQRLPFANIDSEDAISTSELGSSVRVRGSTRIQRSGSFNNLSSSYGHRPTRSYFHHASHGNQGVLTLFLVKK